MKARKILLNAMHLRGNFSGVHRYAENLMKYMETDRFQIDPIQPHDRQQSRIGQGYKITFPRLKRVWHEQTAMKRRFKTGRYDLYHATNYVLPLFWQAPSVLTVHDTIALDYPELCKNETAIYYGLLLKQSIRKSKKVLVVSEQVKKDVIRHTDISEDRIMVTYLGVNQGFNQVLNEQELIRVRKKYDLPKKYCLFVGNLEPKKNLSRLIEAFHKVLTQTDQNTMLLIAGQKGWKYQSIFKTIAKLKLASHVRLLGYVPQQDLPGIYTQASVFVFPSLYEGFGLPAIEAMSFGIPLVISDRGSLPEITGGHASQVNPLNVNDISIGLFEQLTNPNEQKKRVGKEWVKQFSWQKTASRTIEAYEEVLENAS